MSFFSQRSYTRRYFRNKKVLIAGLGLQGGGVGVAKFFARCGAHLTITDVKTRVKLQKSLKELKGISASYVLGRHRKNDFLTADLVIKNPAVSWSSPYITLARSHQVPIDTDVGIFFKLCRVPIIGVTGTKGKSTTATLIYHLLRARAKKTSIFLAGNIGTSVLDVLPRLTPRSYAVLELSSWQLEGMARHKKSPEISVITNILPDHLNRYSNFSSYRSAKELIFTHQKPDDIAVVNFDNRYTRAIIPRIRSRVMLFSRSPQFPMRILSLKKKHSILTGAFMEGDRMVFGEKKRFIIFIHRMALHGRHNLENVLAAVSVAAYLGVSPAFIRKALSAFHGLPHRLEHISSKNGILWYNDTAATIPDAVIAALKTLIPLHPHIILIAGGEDKKLNYGKLGECIPRFVSHLILLPGSASEKLKMEIKKRHKNFFARHTVETNSIKEAVAQAREVARAGDAIILSPGAASFNHFINEFDRGNQFKKAVAELK